MNSLERKAALAVAAAAAGVAVSGAALLKKHAKYLTQKAAATFDPNEDEDWYDEAEKAAPEEAVSQEAAPGETAVKKDPAAEAQEEEES